MASKDTTHLAGEFLPARALSKMTKLGCACICIGLILFIYGKASNNLTVDLIGGRVLVVGMMLVAVRILFWIAVKIVERTKIPYPAEFEFWSMRARRW